MRVTIKVHPGARRTHVGGSVALPDDRERGPASASRALTVSVNAPAVDGRATSAVIEAVARALGVRPREVELVSGTTSRVKVLEVPDACAARLAELFDA